MTPDELMHVLAGRLTPQRDPEPEPSATVTSAPPAALAGSEFGPPVPKKKRGLAAGMPFGAATFLR